MEAKQFQGQNRLLNPPQSWDEKGNGECVGLPIFTDGQSCVSVWQPTAEEIELISSGKPICVRVFSGSVQPPISVGVTAENIILPD